MKRKVKVIDCTPTWLGIYPILEENIRENRNIDYVCDELKKLCIIADEYNKIKRK